MLLKCGLPQSFTPLFLFPVTQTVLPFFSMYPAKSVDCFQNYIMWGDTEFPTMLGTQYALSQHAVGLCVAGRY